MDIETYSEIFKALSHPIRLKIDCGLMLKESCNVNTMSLNLGVAQWTISQHLTVLKNAKVIEGCRNGNQICYKIVSEQIKQLLSGIVSSQHIVD